MAFAPILISHPVLNELAKEIVASISYPVRHVEAQIRKFADGSQAIYLQESVKECDVIILTTSYSPVDKSLFELFLLADTLRAEGAKSIHAVIPYLGFSRQDKKTAKQTSVGMRALARLIEASSVDSVATLDIHNEEALKFFSIPVFSLSTHQMFAETIINEFGNSNLLLVSPDDGGSRRVQNLSSLLKVPCVSLKKTREDELVKIEIGQHTEENIFYGKNIVVVDDICDSGKTLRLAAQELKKYSPRSIIALFTHPVMTREVATNLSFNSGFDRIFTTNSMGDTFDSVPLIHVLSLKGLILEHLSEYMSHLK